MIEINLNLLFGGFEYLDCQNVFTWCFEIKGERRPSHCERDGPGARPAISLDWERPFLGPLYAWSSAIQGEVRADENPSHDQSAMLLAS